MKREVQLKKWPKVKKEALIAGDEINIALTKLQKAASTYSPNNINALNELFYKYAKAKLISELPNLFTKLGLFNIALHKKITNEVNLKTIKVMELASGKRMDKWETFMKIDKKHKWRVLLTDFNTAFLPNPNTIKSMHNFKFTTSVYSLFNNFPKLKPSEKHDVMLSTYTFDNLWLTDDLRLTKANNVWYKELYKLDLSRAGKRLESIAEGKKLDQHFFKDIKIKMKTTKIDLSSIKHGALIDEYYKDHKGVSVNYPGGLMATVVSSFNNQLTKEGMFITADIATVDNTKSTKGFKSVNETIKIKIENYALAKYILEKLGYVVELKSLYEFIKEAEIITPVKIHDHFVFTVKPKD